MSQFVRTALGATLVLGIAVAPGLLGAVEQAPPSPPRFAKATFAGGCFWCMEPPFDELDGVISTTSGYTGGSEPSPTYQQVSAGRTGHAEAVEIIYDPAKVGYPKLLEVFWRNIDPTSASGQFCDHGQQYRPAIFYHGEDQRRDAEASKQAIADRGVLRSANVTEITAASAFYPAEDYHQDYYRKNPVRYKVYRSGCGRDRTLERIWGDH